MSWAANRQTTRVEDTAYCLLESCSITMPLLYEEGTKAFARLQEEIIRTIPDLSIFAWVSPQASHQHNISLLSCGVLAQAPSEFASCGRLVKAIGATAELDISSAGIRISAPLKLLPTGTGKKQHVR